MTTLTRASPCRSTAPSCHWASPGSPTSPTLTEFAGCAESATATSGGMVDGNFAPMITTQVGLNGDNPTVLLDLLPADGEKTGALSEGRTGALLMTGLAHAKPVPASGVPSRRGRLAQERPSGSGGASHRVVSSGRPCPLRGEKHRWIRCPAWSQSLADPRSSP